MTMPTPDDTAVFTLVFSKGLAERNRLPIQQVIKTLQEFQEMVREVGKQVQRRNGVENPDGDFGIELLATMGGLVFRKGSLKAAGAATRDIVNAQETLSLIIDNVRSYSKQGAPQVAPEDAAIARRMYKIGELQREAKTDLALKIRVNREKQQTATLNERAIVNLESLNSPMMRVGGVSLFGRLRQLNDRSKEDDGGTHFWGELITDTDEKWRLRFPSSSVSDVIPLFRRQVFVRGDATYYGNRSPRLDVRHFEHDSDRDYVAAFDALREYGQEVFGDAEPESLIRELHS
jgi:hypothetical protein